LLADSGGFGVIIRPRLCWMVIRDRILAGFPLSRTSTSRTSRSTWPWCGLSGTCWAP